MKQKYFELISIGRQNSRKHEKEVKINIKS